VRGELSFLSHALSVALSLARVLVRVHTQTDRQTDRQTDTHTLSHSLSHALSCLLPLARSVSLSHARCPSLSPADALYRRLNYPPTAAVVIADSQFVVGGGGGKAKSGVPNRITMLAAQKGNKDLEVRAPPLRVRM